MLLSIDSFFNGESYELFSVKERIKWFFLVEGTCNCDNSANESLSNYLKLWDLLFWFMGD